MKRIFAALAVFLGVGVQAVPASADMTYTLNCDSVACSPAGNYGSVTLHQLGTGVAGSATNIVEVTVNLISVMNDFAGTGAGFAINWNITGNPNLTTNIDAHDAANDPLPSGVTYDPTHFAIKDGTATNNNYKASPFGDNWMYAIEYTVNGGRASNDNYLIFDVTKASGLLISDFAAINGFLFAVDIFSETGTPCNTCVVAAKVAEPGTAPLMIVATLGMLFLMQRRRKSVRAN